MEKILCVRRAVTLQEGGSLVTFLLSLTSLVWAASHHPTQTWVVFTVVTFRPNLCVCPTFLSGCGKGGLPVTVGCAGSSCFCHKVQQTLQVCHFLLKAHLPLQSHVLRFVKSNYGSSKSQGGTTEITSFIYLDWCYSISNVRDHWLLPVDLMLSLQNNNSGFLLEC